MIAAVVGAFVCGMVAGTFLAMAWFIKQPSPIEPTEHGPFQP
ncbi:hypothetical protein ACSVBT_06895 [Afipia sp. TerB]